MTLIIGVNLGNAVGIIGDTRVTYSYPSGKTVRYDDVQKVYEFGSFIVGVAGDVLSASRLIWSVYESHLQGLRIDQALQKTSDLAWFRSTLVETHGRDVAAGRIDAASRFAYII